MDNNKDYMSYSQESDCLIVQIKERFDEKNCFQLQNSISELLKQTPSHLFLDLNDVKIIRSSGLRVILTLAKEFKNKNHKFALIYSKTDSNYQVSQILEVSGFMKIVNILATKKEAIEYSQPSQA